MAVHKTHRPARPAALMLALGAAGALGLAACGSSGAGTTTTTRPSTGLGGGGGGSVAVNDASTLCARTNKAITDFRHLDLSSISSASSAAGTLMNDVSQVQAAVASLSSASGTSGNANLQMMVSTAKAGMTALDSAMAQFRSGNLGSAKADVSTAVQDFQASRNAGTKINIRSCF